MEKPNIVVSILHLLGVVVLRFRPIPRVWAIWLMTVNLASVAFLDRLEGQVVFAAAGLSVVGMALIYRQQRFTRLLGICHVLFVPMLAWLALRADTIQTDPALALWVSVLAVTNVVSLVVDTTDVTRFLRGERQPHYAW